MWYFQFFPSGGSEEGSNAVGASPGTPPSLATGTGEIWASQGLLQPEITPARDYSAVTIINQGLLKQGNTP